ncbi:holo-ACP synthase [Limobrevibacterium gyesilva]|uniref:Holo-[acyl-carrier-protein] synthase n=1 Tax=Limobrevibacterium gyesilva TaxID=2991712 RepID=A0AA41YLW2_9PROT|nr:holo-ACP synthase [Limobrevibacterium gyesilva]
MGSVIIGAGTDLCYIERIRRSLRRFGDAYLEQLFTKDERAPHGSGVDLATFYTRAFCGKEACAKALGTGLANGVGWRDIEVLQTQNCATLRLSNGAFERLRQLTPTGRRATLHVTCASDQQMAQAFVVISAF